MLSRYLQVDFFDYNVVSDFIFLLMFRYSLRLLATSNCDMLLLLMQQHQQQKHQMERGKLQQQPRQQNANKYVKNLHVCHHLLPVACPTAIPPARQATATRNRLFNLLHKCFKSHSSFSYSFSIISSKAATETATATTGDNPRLLPLPEWAPFRCRWP